MFRGIDPCCIWSASLVSCKGNLWRALGKTSDTLELRLNTNGGWRCNWLCNPHPRGQCSETGVRVHGCIRAPLPPLTLRLVGNLVHSFAAVCLDITINIRLMATPKKRKAVWSMSFSTACWCIDTLLIDTQYAHDVFPLSNTIALRALFPCTHQCYVHNQSIRHCERWTRFCVNVNSKSASGRLCDGGEIRLLMCKYKDMEERDREGLRIRESWHDMNFFYSVCCWPFYWQVSCVPKPNKLSVYSKQLFSKATS